MATPIIERVAVGDHGSETVVGGRNVGVGSHSHRVGSRNPADHGPVSGREEAWRFTPLRRLRGLHSDAPLTGTDFTISVQGQDGVTASILTGAEAAAVKGISKYQPIDFAAARSYQAAQSVYLVDVAPDTVTGAPVVVTLHGNSIDEAIAAHLVIRVGRHAQAQVVVAYEGSATISENVEIVVGDGATLTYVSEQNWAADAVHLTNHHVLVGRDAKVKHAALTFGGDLVRMVGSVAYDAPGGDAEMLGVYFADAGQHLEHRLFMDHEAPHCKSRVLYKGALQGRSAHTVWVGDVLIRAGAEGTDTYEMNRNLLLTDGARADSVPNLEIETGEIVGAGHASATGRFDDEQLFYLLSRGIPEAIARRLVVRGFFGEVLHQLGVESVVERATETIEAELAVIGI
ncbi:Iron-regulated ABC transporter permease protein SufD [Nakamurella panacisegetis]|uniref:Iron-regulated ABC transporter permease protein SufD n=1 Tax=Nakamurella panacisegetis TaxID=1090615 RepID=A0A1H0SHT2_9ACTN|nr:Fe-S cluster assembly protein SufD [Nakamurella panacisegetis]SDP40778.1 Iron-regulated ABC transporter permease protein SufD [Nakamurella panacisegetis]